MMNPNVKQFSLPNRAVVFRALHKVLVPVARLAMRYGLTYRTVVAAIKEAFVDAAVQAHKQGSKLPSNRRIALLTGVDRKDVAAILADGPGEPDETSLKLNPMAAILGSWMREPGYAIDGEAKTIDIRGPAPSLEDLANRYCRDIGCRAALDQLQESGNVEVLPQGKVTLLKTTFVPGRKDLEFLNAGCNAGRRLLDTVWSNLSEGGSVTFQRQYWSRYIPSRNVEALSVELTAHFESSHQQMVELVDRHESSPDDIDTLMVVGGGGYMFVNEDR